MLFIFKTIFFYFTKLKNYIAAIISNIYFVNTGSNKRLAKNAASAAALNKLRNFHLSEDPSPINHQVVSSEEQEKADLIGR